MPIAIIMLLTLAGCAEADSDRYQRSKPNGSGGRSDFAALAIIAVAGVASAAWRIRRRKARQ